MSQVAENVARNQSGAASSSTTSPDSNPTSGNNDNTNDNESKSNDPSTAAAGATQQDSQSSKNDGNPTHIVITKSIEKNKKSASPTSIKLSLKRLGIIVKLSFLALIVFLFASVGYNIYQAILNDCRQLEDQVDKLEAENQNLQDSIDKLNELKSDLENTRIEFTEENDRLIANVDALKSLRKTLVDNEKGLENVSNLLEEILDDFNLTFDEFEEEVDEIKGRVNDTINEVKNLTLELNGITDSITEIRVELAEEVDLLQIINRAKNESGTEFILLNERDDFLEVLIPSEFLDKINGFVQGEYNHLMSEIDFVFFAEASNSNQLLQELRSQFSFNDAFDYDIAREMLATIRELLPET